MSLLASGLAAYTERTVTNPEQLEAEPAQIRADGQAVEDSEHQPGVRAVAVPVVFDEEVVAAVSARAAGWTSTPSCPTSSAQRCDSEGRTCTGISGATAGTYTLFSDDAGHTVRVAVTGTASAGSATASSSATDSVAVQTPRGQTLYTQTIPSGTSMLQAAAAGFADEVTMGATGWFRKHVMHSDDNVDRFARDIEDDAADGARAAKRARDARASRARSSEAVRREKKLIELVAKRLKISRRELGDEVERHKWDNNIPNYETLSREEMEGSREK